MASSPEKDIWFKARPYGWGWYPSTWQGWIVIYAAIGAIFYGVHDTPELEAAGKTETEVLPVILVRIALPVIILLMISYAKGEKPRWRWSSKAMSDDWKAMSQSDRKVFMLGTLGLIVGVISFAMFMVNKSV